MFLKYVHVYMLLYEIREIQTHPETLPSKGIVVRLTCNSTILRRLFQEPLF